MTTQLTKHQLAARATVIFNRIEEQERKGYITVADIEEWLKHGQRDYFPDYIKEAAKLLAAAAKHSVKTDYLRIHESFSPHLKNN